MITYTHRVPYLSVTEEYDILQPTQHSGDVLERVIMGANEFLIDKGHPHVLVGSEWGKAEETETIRNSRDG
jgi:hypothetical protein